MDQISVLSMAQAVTEKRQNPPAAENSQTQSSFREMLADRRKALDKGGEEAFPTEKTGRGESRRVHGEPNRFRYGADALGGLHADAGVSGKADANTGECAESGERAPAHFVGNRDIWSPE
ncbi:hypothetical protein [Dysosmobacter welbionis]|uniref:hypothetical protein n=1 Tax=Dysosmobacter welbionis TaxID=2093857 RepID=UPI003A934551